MKRSLSVTFLCIIYAWIGSNLNAQGFAPSSVAGRTAVIVIASGSGLLATSGGTLLTFAASGSAFQEVALTATVLGGTGTYTWTKTGNNTGTAVLVDSSTGIASSSFVTFTSTAGGTYSTVSSVGVQNGSFLWQGYSDLNPFLDVSTRGFVGTGSNILIGGFVIGGSIPKNVLIRAVGPTLASLGVTGTLSDPVVTVYNASGVAVANNSGWANSATIASADASVGAFALNVGSSDAALVLTLSPGAYTAQVAGKSGDTGVALIEVYELPQ